MEQAKNYVCRSCSTPVPLSHKFCGRCGAAIPAEIMNARTQFFGQLQTPGKAKLILIRGEGVEGLSYQLNAEQHLVGRNGQLVFPWVALPHSAQLFNADNGAPMWISILVALVYAAVLGLIFYWVVVRPLRHAPALARVCASVGLMLYLMLAKLVAFKQERGYAADMGGGD